MLELTSLLDVIMIVMFLILMQSRNQVNTANMAATESSAAKEEMASEMAALKAENESLKRLTNGRAAADANSDVISISLQSGENGREILLESTPEGSASAADTESISLTWDNRNYASNALYAALSRRIHESTAQVVFLIFEYDRNDIYQSDYTLIMDAIQRQKQDPRVYTVEYDTLREGNPQ